MTAFVCAQQSVSSDLQQLLQQASAGDVQAQFTPGKKYHSGTDVTRNDDVAFQYAPAEAALGALYETGEGAPADSILAYAWTDLAARQKDASARQRLSRLQSQLTSAQRDVAKAHESQLFPQPETSVH